MLSSTRNNPTGGVVTAALALALLAALAGSARGQCREAKLTAPDAAAEDRLGYFSVGVSDDTAIAGSARDDDDGSGSGSAHIFVRTGTTWAAQAELTASDASEFDYFGHAVAIQGDTAVVGAANADDQGAAYVFVRQGTTWTEQARLTASDGAQGDGFGGSVAIHGDLAIIGAQFDDDLGVDSGSAYVFARSGTAWTEKAKLNGDPMGHHDYFGGSVALEGDTAVVGAAGENDDFYDAGAAFVFVRQGATWGREARLSASDALPAGRFGGSVSISGDVALVGSDQEAAYVFARSGTSWSEQAILGASDGAGGDRFGRSVVVAGDTALVGAYRACSDRGATYMFVRNGALWPEQSRFSAIEPTTGTQFGAGVSISGDTILVGARDIEARGAGYVFRSNGSPCDPLGEVYCDPGVANSSGMSGVITVTGSPVVCDDDLTLSATQLPTGSNIGYFIMGTGMNTFIPAGSAGPICVAPGLERYLPPVNNTNELPGGFSRTVGTSGPVSSQITPGSTWNFQAWHRDSMAGTSNLTAAVSVTFE